jgi:hypothetical protein
MVCFEIEQLEVLIESDTIPRYAAKRLRTAGGRSLDADSDAGQVVGFTNLNIDLHCLSA